MNQNQGPFPQETHQQSAFHYPNDSSSGNKPFSHPYEKYSGNGPFSYPYPQNTPQDESFLLDHPPLAAPSLALPDTPLQKGLRRAIISMSVLAVILASFLAFKFLDQPTQHTNQGPSTSGYFQPTFVATSTWVADASSTKPPIISSLPTATHTKIQPTNTPSPSSVVPVLVQHTFKKSIGTSNQATLPQSVKNGDLIVIAITQFDTDLISLTDNLANHYTQVLNMGIANSSTQNDRVELFYAANVKGGALTVNLTFTQPKRFQGDSNLGIYEYSGLSKTNPLDSAAANAQYGSTPSGVSPSVSGNNEVCFAVGVDTGLVNDSLVDPPPSAGAGFTLRDHQDAASAAERFYSEDAIVGPGKCTPTFSLGYENPWAIIGASFKP
jgi:hypothetical protein